MSLSHDDVERIIGLLDCSHFDELTLEMDGVKLALRRHGASPSHSAALLAASAVTPIAPVSAQQQVAPVPAAGLAPAAAAVSGLLDVKAPMLGTFYRAPKPGTQPFVQVGSKVGPDDPIGIIEVMKLMNAIPAGLHGEIIEVLAQDGEMVEYDQVLMRVRPA
jgi:acetyl-CoA carboxylase biotin carboxyl carrier protein